MVIKLYIYMLENNFKNQNKNKKDIELNKLKSN